MLNIREINMWAKVRKIPPPCYSKKLTLFPTTWQLNET